MTKLNLTFDINVDIDFESTIENILELIGNGATAGQSLDGAVEWFTEEV